MLWNFRHGLILAYSTCWWWESLGAKTGYNCMDPQIHARVPFLFVNLATRLKINCNGIDYFNRGELKTKLLSWANRGTTKCILSANDWQREAIFTWHLKNFLGRCKGFARNCLQSHEDFILEIMSSLWPLKLLESILITFLVGSQRFRRDPKRCCPQKKEKVKLRCIKPLFAMKLLRGSSSFLQEQIKTRYVTFSIWLLTCYDLNVYERKMVYETENAHFCSVSATSSGLYTAAWRLMENQCALTRVDIMHDHDYCPLLRLEPSCFTFRPLNLSCILFHCSTSSGNSPLFQPVIPAQFPEACIAARMDATQWACATVRASLAQEAPYSTSTTVDYQALGRW